jgi:hypothetical protein
MQLLKIGFILSLVGSLCSFAYYSAQEDSREQLYKKFLGQFEQVDLPSTMTLKAYIVTNKIKPKKNEKQLESLENGVKTSNLLGSEYASFIPEIEFGKMSRMGSNTYKAELALVTNGKYSAVIYSVTRSFDGDGKSYVLATFDGHGVPLKNRNLGYSSLEEEIELTISNKMELTIKRLLVEGDTEEYEGEISKMFITPKGEILVHEEDQPLEELEPVQKVEKLKFS